MFPRPVADEMLEALKSNKKLYEHKVNALTLALLDGVDKKHHSSCVNFIWEMAKIYPTVSDYQID